MSAGDVDDSWGDSSLSSSICRVSSDNRTGARKKSRKRVCAAHEKRRIQEHVLPVIAFLVRAWTLRCRAVILGAAFDDGDAGAIHRRDCLSPDAVNQSSRRAGNTYSRIKLMWALESVCGEKCR